MPQNLIQTQEQKLAQVQKLTQQQMLQVRLLEMPLPELEENINAELDDNPALEVKSPGDSDDYEGGESEPDATDDGYDESQEQQEKADALDSALESIGSDDEMPAATYSNDNQNADYEEMVYGDTTSFYDKLKEQMDMLELTPEQHDVMEYLIGSLDDDGILRKSLDTISDELAIYHNIDVTPGQVGKVLAKLQQFDPAGVGAQSLQQCLLLQIDRRPDDKLKPLMKEIIAKHFDEFTKKHWDKIGASMQLTPDQCRILEGEIKKLNPKPGAALGETEGRNVQQITPDFIVDTADDGTVTFQLNHGNVPELKVSPSFVEMVDTYKNNRHNMNRRDKEALLYAKEKVDKARGYIEAIKRQHTLMVTMKAIINWQYKFFQDGDEADLRPMILKDIAQVTGLDKSTISRVSNVKYAETKWGTFPLRYFFSEGYNTGQGEEQSTRKMKLALKEIISGEDKQHPLSDDALAELMKQKGYPLARRTISKYREQLGLPVARLRKE